MRFSRIILATVILTILHFLYAWLTCGWLFSELYQLAPTYVWVPESLMQGTFFLWVSLGNLVLIFFFVLILAKILCCLPGDCPWGRGAVFGVFVWLLGVLPGMFSMHMFMTVNKLVLIYWIVSGLVWLVFSGAVAGWLIDRGEASTDKECCCS